MTTNESVLTNATGPILSLDLGKYKSVACIYVSNEDIRFLTISTCRTQLTRLIDDLADITQIERASSKSRYRMGMAC